MAEAQNAWQAFWWRDLKANPAQPEVQIDKGPSTVKLRSNKRHVVGDRWNSNAWVPAQCASNHTEQTKAEE